MHATVLLPCFKCILDKMHTESHTHCCGKNQHRQKQSRDDSANCCCSLMLSSDNMFVMVRHTEPHCLMSPQLAAGTDSK